MRVSRVVAVLFALMFAVSSFAQVEGFYRCSGTSILDPNGEPFLIKGNDLSHWNNTEAYSLRLNAVHSRHIGSDSSIRTRIREIVGEANAATFWDTFTANFLTEADVAGFAVEGFNTIRFSFNYRLLSPAATPGVYSAEGFAVMAYGVRRSIQHRGDVRHHAVVLEALQHHFDTDAVEVAATDADA